MNSKQKYMYQLLETIRIEHGKPQHLYWHQARMNASYRFLFHKDCPFQLCQILSTISFNSQTTKLRFLYNAEEFMIERQLYQPASIQTLLLVTSNSIEYAHKYADREVLNKLRTLKKNHDEILIIKNGRVTDTSFSNILLLNDGIWYTPAKPLLNGTCRQRLLYENKIRELHITPDMLHKFSHFKLINAMLNMEDSPSIAVSNIFDV